MSSKVHQGDQALTWEKGLAHIHIGPQMKKDGEGMLTPCPASLCPWDLWLQDVRLQDITGTPPRFSWAMTSLFDRTLQDTS